MSFMQPEDTPAEFIGAYIETAMWSSTYATDDREDNPMDDGAHDLSDSARAEMTSDCADFWLSFGALCEDDPSRAGHDFWLTRAGHGAGFWDGDWDYPMPADHEAASQYRTVGDYLAAMAKPYGAVDLYIGDDGLIYHA